MSETKYTIFVASHEFFQTHDDFVAAIGTGHPEIVAYEFAVPSNLGAELAHMIAYGILFGHDWCPDGIYYELRPAITAKAVPVEPVFDNEAATRELYVIGATARCFNLEPDDCLDMQWLRADFFWCDEKFWQNATAVRNSLCTKSCPVKADINDIVRSKTTFDSVVARFRSMPTDELIHRYTTRDFTGPFIRSEP